MGTGTEEVPYYNLLIQAQMDFSTCWDSFDFTLHNRLEIWHFGLLVQRSFLSKLGWDGLLKSLITNFFKDFCACMCLWTGNALNSTALPLWLQYIHRTYCWTARDKRTVGGHLGHAAVSELAQQLLWVGDLSRFVAWRCWGVRRQDGV